jgi:hypothetical protein
MASSAPTGFGSTYLSPKITTYADLVYRCKVLLGFPYQKDELYDEQWATFIDDAVETATEWGAFTKEEYIVFSSDFYVPGCGVKLDDIVNYRCGDERCTMTTVTETVTSIDYFCNTIETATAYLSASPFVYPTTLDVNDPNSTAFTGPSGQSLYVYFDPKNPWRATNVCQADCITIAPVSSQWFQLGSNPALSGIVFDFVHDPVLSTVASQVSAFTTYPLSAVPLITMGAELSAVPTSYYDIGAFYPPDDLAYPPVEACINISDGLGYIYPKCDTSLINACSALSSQYSLSPLWEHALSGNFYIGGDGRNYPLSATDISKATHVKLLGIPSCTINGSIPLLSNDGIVATFVLCNTAISTNGPMYMDDVQFFHDYKLPAEAADSRCGWNNNGFTMKFNNFNYEDCIRYTPSKVKVDVSFCKNIVMNTGTVTTVVSADFDETLNRRRKVHGVFNVDDVSGAGGGFFGGSGGDVLFNFDYALMGSVFGYDLQGQRNFGHPGGFNLTTYHMARSFIEHSRKMLRYVSYHFDPKTQYLKVHPEPGGTGRQAYILGVKTESPVEEMLSNYFIREFVLARAMQTIGIVRSKFGNATLYSGQTISGDKLMDLGTAKLEQLMKELRDEYRYNEPPSFFFG